MKAKNTIIGVLILLLIPVSYLYVGAKRQVEEYRFMQFTDFHESLMNLSLTLTDLSALVNTENMEKELFPLALENERKNLTSIYNRISVIEARLDPQKNSFSTDYTIQELKTVIISIANIIEALEEQNLDPTEVENVNIALRNITNASRELAASKATEDLSPEDIKVFIDKAKHELEKVQS